MARYTEPVCKLCRREGAKLFLKGYRCYTEKCAFERRSFAPGMHGRGTGRRRKVSDYALQLREKQKVKRMYGLLESQFRNYFRTAAQRTGVTGEALLVSLECRLDNIIYRMGFAPSRVAARQLVRHRHFLVDGRSVDIASYRLHPGQEVRVRNTSKELGLIQSSVESRRSEQTLPWLQVDFAALAGRMVTEPTRAEIPVPVQEQLIVELYSK